MIFKRVLICSLIVLLSSMEVRHNLWSLADKQLSKITDINRNVILQVDALKIAVVPVDIGNLGQLLIGEAPKIMPNFHGR
jgi:hypothetical protein